MDSKSSPEEPRYWSFVCHAAEDEPWARWLHTSLEVYGLPKILQGKPSRFGPLPKRLFPIFLDREELPLGSVEGDQIEAALRWSRTLIVICSPTAAASAEVDRQIRYFKSLGRDNEVFCLLVDDKAGGTKSEFPQPELLPKAARFQIGADQKATATPANPLVVDVRQGGDSRLTGRLKLVAAILGCGFADLKQRDVERNQRRVQMVFSVVLVLMMILVALGVQLYVEKNRAVEARIEAERQREAAVASERRARMAHDQAFRDRKQAELARDKAEEARKSVKKNRSKAK